MIVSICTFNIAHGRGLAKSSWQGGALQERKDRLDQIAEVIGGCDIAVLQEVDFRAPWTYFTQNQHSYLKRKAGFPHSMTFASHRLCPSAGIAILSRFPLSDREVICLPQHSKLEGLLGYRKHALACTVTLEKVGLQPSWRARKEFRFIGIHLDYRGRSVTVPAAKKLLDYTKQQKMAVVMAGDFNATPLCFPNPWDQEPTALDKIRDSGLFRTLPKHPTAEDMTHPTDDPRCIIDWIMIPPEWGFASYSTLDVSLSDHRPVIARVEVPGIHVTRKG